MLPCQILLSWPLVTQQVITGGKHSIITNTDSTLNNSWKAEGVFQVCSKYIPRKTIKNILKDCRDNTESWALTLLKTRVWFQIPCMIPWLPLGVITECTFRGGQKKRKWKKRKKILGCYYEKFSRVYVAYAVRSQFIVRENYFQFIIVWDHP